MRFRRSLCTLLTVGVAASVTAATGSSATAADKTPTVKIILLAETTGESSAAVPYYANGAEMAKDELGSRVEYTRIPAPLPPAGAETAFLRDRDALRAGRVVATAQAQYVVDTQKKKKIGLECVDNATGVNGCNAAKKVIQGK